jgi:hypothetical protein
MSSKKQLYALVCLLVALGVGVTVYKVVFLGFALSPSARERVWTAEAEITFEADGGPVEVSLNHPDNFEDLTIVDVVDENSGYANRIIDDHGVTRVVWTRDKASGPQKIYQRIKVYRQSHAQGIEPFDPGNAEPEAPRLSGAAEMFADTLLNEAREKRFEPVPMAMELLRLLNAPENNTSASSLLELKDDLGGPLGVARALLHRAGIESRQVGGIFLGKQGINTPYRTYLEVRDGPYWVLLDPRTATAVDSDAFLLWQLNDESLLEVVGGSNSKVAFSTVEDSMLANQAAIASELGRTSPLVDFSIYTLPVQVQTAFKLLLLIPLGAFVVVVMRSLVGIRTSGTFLPILIALTFLQTSLLPGIGLFILIVSMGLALRSYLSRLNLLLVPRISAVLVFVIIIYLAISVISHKMGCDVGLLVTFFPMIIVSWTIERMSILWEEEGVKEVLIQGGGSLLTSSLIYLVLTNRLVGHLTYSFPELLLIVLAVILLIGNYTGYRLSELRRFEPLK